MKQYIGCDALFDFVSMDETGRAGPPVRVEHDELEIRRFLGASKCHAKAVIAVARHRAESSWWILSKQQGLSGAGAVYRVFVQERVSAVPAPPAIQSREVIALRQDVLD